MEELHAEVLRTDVVTLQIDENTSIRVRAVAPRGREDVVDWEQVLPFKEVTDTIERVANAMLATIDKIRPEKATVEFGIEVGFESGALTALIAKGSGTGNLKVTLEWGGGDGQNH